MLLRQRELSVGATSRRVTCATMSCIPNQVNWVVYGVSDTAVASDPLWSVVLCNMDTSDTIEVDKGKCTGGCAPQSVSISQDGILAVAMGSQGVRLYAVAPRLGDKPGYATALHTFRDGCASFTEFVWNSASERALLARYCDAKGVSRIMLHGCLTRTTASSIELMNIPTDTITSLSAASPGNVAVLVASENVLHVLVATGGDATFKRQSLNLLQCAASRGSAGYMLPVNAVVGTTHVVIGYSSLSTTGNGLVEVVSLTDNTMTARRTLLGANPMALACHGPRVLVGGDSRHDECRRMFLFSATEEENYALAQNDDSPWAQESTVLRGTGYCFAARESSPSGEVQSVIHWGVVALSTQP